MCLNLSESRLLNRLRNLNGLFQPIVQTNDEILFILEILSATVLFTVSFNLLNLLV